MPARIGKLHHSVKLTPEDVILMRSLFAERRRLMALADKLTIEKIAAKFEVNFTTARDAIFRQTWKQVRDHETYEVG